MPDVPVDELDSMEKVDGDLLNLSPPPPRSPLMLLSRDRLFPVLTVLCCRCFGVDS